MYCFTFFRTRVRFSCGALALSVAAALTACAGTIGEDDRTGDGPATPSDGSNGSGAGGTQAMGSDSSPATDGTALPKPGEDPGSVTIHRLNRVEYTNTTRDLLGTTLRPADDFPTDDRGYGYDNIADVLSLSPVLLEMYFNAAETFVDEAMKATDTGARRYEAEATAWILYSNGSVEQVVSLPDAGTYRLTVRAWAQQAGTDPARMSLDVDGLPVQTFDVTATEGAPQTYTTEVEITGSNPILAVTFLNDFFLESTGEDRNLFVDWLEVEGPLGVQTGNPQRKRIMVCEPDASDPAPCLRSIARAFGRRAYRRPLTDTEVDDLVGLASAGQALGESVDDGVKLMLQAMLVSPHFIFRVERDPDPTSTSPHHLTEHELACRLSYFLWSSMPDDELLTLADQGRLSAPAMLRAQVERMLGDPRAGALIENFAGQWLHIREIDEHVPDYNYFPSFDEPLRGAMRAETERYIAEFFFGDASMGELLSADFSFVNDRLARHYGLPAVGSDEVQRVSLAGTERRGLLTQAGILMVTSYATRTSPVKRGKWVLTQLLCQEPPPPPPNIPALAREDTPSGSLRERMEAHRSDPVCASCHAVMDPIGFGFENFDAVGTFRSMDGSFEIDASGALPGDKSFEGALELSDLLSQDPHLPRCMAEQLLSYALGRGVENYDEDDLDTIGDNFVAGGMHMRELIAQVVLSDAFRMRRAQAAQEAKP